MPSGQPVDGIPWEPGVEAQRKKTEMGSKRRTERIAPRTSESDVIAVFVLRDGTGEVRLEATISNCLKIRHVDKQLDVEARITSILTGDASSWVVLWDLKTKHTVGIWEAHKTTILCFASSENGASRPFPPMPRATMAFFGWSLAI